MAVSQQAKPSPQLITRSLMFKYTCTVCWRPHPSPAAAAAVGNPIPRRYDDDCSNTVLYSEPGSVDEAPVIYQDVHFNVTSCHRYSLRAIMLQTDYGKRGIFYPQQTCTSE